MINNNNNREKVKINIWDVIDKLSDFTDISDPDVNIPNAHHLFQTAEAARLDCLPEWFQLTCLLHDMGKIMFLWGNDNDGTSINKQWGIVGDTFIVGCMIPDAIVYPEFNKLNKDHNMYSKYGIYKNNCSLDNCLISTTRLCLYISAPAFLAPKAIAFVVLVGSVYPSSGV